MTTATGALEGAASFTIPAEHPALPGHFPGAPVVPGVVILDEVLAAIGAGPDAPRSFAWIKFARPLLPGQRAEISWRRSAGQLRFTVTHAGLELVRGQLGGGSA
jgi:3-hydroxymyristoyl/3-hydroxydecanoyl-(acyl carrier protein) dehydratase